MALSLSADNHQGIDPLHSALKWIQGNIVKSHGREHAAHLFFEFRPDSSIAQRRASVNAYYQQYVTPALTQHERAAQYHQAKQQDTEIKETLFGSIFISFNGYTHMALDHLFSIADGCFKQGLGGEQGDWKTLGDPSPDNWQLELAEEADLLLLIAHNDSSQLDRITEEVKALFAESADLIHRERGFVLRNSQNQPIEHFGYVDGISQPLFTRDKLSRYRQQQSGKENLWEPAAPLGLVLAQDPAIAEAGHFGSYLVYRKLEQNVKAFRQQHLRLAEKLAISPSLAAAYSVGRFKDGTPVLESPAPLSASPIDNNFNYADDPMGLKCPFQSHIRKTNPRGFSPDPFERSRRIVRRGISYGLADLAILEKTPPSHGSGLLFLCFQADIKKQFSFMQRLWCNNKDFEVENTGVDPVVGQGSQASLPQKWPQQWGEQAVEEMNLHNFVTMRGGGYYFAPSIKFLQTIEKL